MFDGLRREIEELEAPVDDRALTELLTLRDRFDARLSTVIAEVDAAELWRGDGSLSMRQWLERNLRMTSIDAMKAVKTSRRVQRCAALRSAWEAGRISSGQVEAVSANVSEPLLDLFEEHHTAIVERLEGMDAADTTTVMRAWAERAKVLLKLDGKDPYGADKELFLSDTLDGHGRINGNFDAASFDTVKTAVRLAESRDAEGEQRTPAERRGDALTDICQFFLDRQTTRTGGRHRPHVNVVIDLEHLATGFGARTLAGLPLSGAAIKRLLCDANIHRVVTDGRSSILDYGRATRTIPPAVYTSLVLRDLHCRFPGCHMPPEWTEAHHIKPWEEGGETCLTNLCLLCSRHHHLIHEKGWHIKLLPTGTVEVTRPDGRVMTSDPPVAA